jgi:ADP-dependent NAD(P)H-hydrate dehydratase / NAD(P)H-hydrate epimerase
MGCRNKVLSHSIGFMELLAKSFFDEEFIFLAPSDNPVYSVPWVEHAAEAFADWFEQKYKKDRFDKKIKIFCGMGDKGATGLATAALLADKSFIVKVYVLRHTHKTSPAFDKNLPTVSAPKWLHTPADMPRLTENDILIDAIIGTGLNRPLEGLTAHVMQAMNGIAAPRITLDIATGLYADKHTGSTSVFQPDYTATFTFPKLAFLMAENQPYVGDYFVLHTGLEQTGTHQPENDFQYITADMVKEFFKKRNKFTVREELGKALLLAGSNSRLGAAILATRACLRTGVGKLTVRVPATGQNLLQNVVPEACVEADAGKDFLMELPDTQAYTAVGIGAGIGEQAGTSTLFERLLSRSLKPMVLEGDAVEMLCQYRHLLSKIPPQSVLLLSGSEFARLTEGDFTLRYQNDFERLTSLRNFAEKYKVVTLLQTANSPIATPEGKWLVNFTGTFASHGVEAVLMGIITSLLAQGYEAWQAAALGVYLHGLATDLTVMKKGQSGMVASDIIESLPACFRKLEEG